MDGTSLKKWLSAFAVAAAGTIAWPAPASADTDKIEFPEEELAAESVLPVFDNPSVVRARLVKTEGRFELGPMGGYSMSEPFFQSTSYGATGTYHFTEEHGLNILGYAFSQGLNANGQGLNPIPQSDPVVNANLQFAPAPKFLLLGNYQFTGFYGKISLTKDWVMSLHTYALGGIGVIGIGDGVKPAGSIGLGQKFYITPNFALRFDLRFVAYQGPDILSRALYNVTAEQPASSFSDKLNTTSLLGFGAVFLL